MAVVSCTLSREPREGRRFVDSGGGISAEAIVLWRVVTDDPADGWITVSLGAEAALPDPLPKMFATYNVGGETEPNLLFQEVTPTQNRDKLTEWILRGVYRNLPLGLVTGDVQPPLSRPWRFRLGFEVVSEPVTEGVNITEINPLGAPEKRRPALTISDNDTLAEIESKLAANLGPIVNSAGQKFEETFEQPKTQPILFATKNFQTLEEVHEIELQYSDSVNAQTFLSFPRFHCDFRGVQTSDLILESGVEYYQATVQIGLSGKPKFLNALNVGWKAWDTVGETGAIQLVNAKDDNGADVSEPAFLTASGTSALSDPPSQVDAISYLTRTRIKDFNELFA